MKELSDRELFAVIVDLLQSTASRLAVAKHGWSRRTYPIQNTLQDLWDSQERANFLFLSANSKKPPAAPNEYPRGTDKPKENKSSRKVMKMTPQQAAKFYTGLVKKRDASVTPEEIKQRNIEYLRREEKKNGSSGSKK